MPNLIFLQVKIIIVIEKNRKNRNKKITLVMQSRYGTNMLCFAYTCTHTFTIYTLYTYISTHMIDMHTLYTQHTQHTTNTAHMHTHTIHIPLNVLATYTVSDSTDTWGGEFFLYVFIFKSLLLVQLIHIYC